MDRSVDKLACVARLVFDQRVLDLRKENEELRAKVAWNEFGQESLQEWLRSVNQITFPEQCNCYGCFQAARFNHTDEGNGPSGDMHFMGSDDEPRECLVRKQLLWHANQLGLVVVEKTVGDGGHDEAHLVLYHYAEGHDYQWDVVYGSKLSRDNFHVNPDLDKIKKLITLVDQDHGFEFFESNNPE